MKESYIEKKCITFAKKKGYTCRKIKFIATNGCPDRVFYKPNHFFFVEFKNEDGILSKIQEYQIDLLIKAGQLVYIIDNYEDFIKLLK